MPYQPLCTWCSHPKIAKLKTLQVWQKIIIYISNFGETDVAPAKNYKVNKVEKWQKFTAGLNPNYMHIFKP